MNASGGTPTRANFKQGSDATRREIAKLYLPAATGVPEQLAAEAGTSGSEHGDEAILIVEDDALIR